MNAIKLNLIDYEVVKELRKIDGKLVILGIAIVILFHDNIVGIKRIKRLEKDLRELKEASKED